MVDGQLQLSQQQFFIGDSHDTGRLWQIPLNANYKEAPQIMKEKAISLGNYQELRQQNGKPFRLNVGNNSHFIVKYDQTLMNDLLDHLDELNAIDQRQLLQDFRLLADGQQLSYADIIPLLPQFADSHSEIVNTALYAIVNKLKQFVTPDSAEEKALKKFVNQLSAKQVSRTRLGTTCW